MNHRNAALFIFFLGLFTFATIHEINKGTFIVKNTKINSYPLDELTFYEPYIYQPINVTEVMCFPEENYIYEEVMTIVITYRVRYILPTDLPQICTC